MQEIIEKIEEYFNPDVYKAVLSSPAQNEAAEKVVINRIADFYQVEKYIKSKVYHENLTYQKAKEMVIELTGAVYNQFNAWDDRFEYSLRISKKGKLLSGKNPCAAPPKEKQEHNRAKQHLLQEGTVIPPLVDMGIFTPDGRVVKSMYDKYKQINRFIEVIDDELGNWDASKTLHVIDFGCGKSYLTFILYYYLVELKKFSVKMTGLDLKEDVIQSCNKAAAKYGYQDLKFEMGNINGYQTDAPVDMVITLHACDTATDYALYNAVCWNAKYIFSVPCCQHEFNLQMKSERMSILTQYGIIQERVAALMTDAVRANLLTCCGYKTQVLEFVDLSHTPKNLLIRATRSQLPRQTKKGALDEVTALCEEFHLQPTLLKLLNEKLKSLSETEKA